MKTLVISDIHGNRAALEAVIAAEPFDILACLGDIVGYGPEPGACTTWIRAHAALAVQGNHDNALATGAPPQCRPGFEWIATATAPLGRAQVCREDIAWLGALPRWSFLESGGMKCLLVHATPSSPLYRYLGPDRDAWQTEIEPTGADLVIVGHTHLQFDMDVGPWRVVNPGSVGQPKDGDPRAAYAVIDRGDVRLARVAYPIEETVSALEHSGVPPAVVLVLASLLRTGRLPPESKREPRADAQASAASTEED